MFIKIFVIFSHNNLSKNLEIGKSYFLLLTNEKPRCNTKFFGAKPGSKNRQKHTELEQRESFSVHLTLNKKTHQNSLAQIHIKPPNSQFYNKKKSKNKSFNKSVSHNFHSKNSNPRQDQEPYSYRSKSINKRDTTDRQKQKPNWGFERRMNIYKA